MLIAKKQKLFTLRTVVLLSDGQNFSAALVGKDHVNKTFISVSTHGLCNENNVYSLAQKDKARTDWFELISSDFSCELQGT